MCMVSAIGDAWKNTWPDIERNIPNYPFIQPIGPTRYEFDLLKAEIEELKKVLLAAKEYDAKTGQKDCEMADKVALIKEVARVVGVDLEEIFK